MDVGRGGRGGVVAKEDKKTRKKGGKGYRQRARQRGREKMRMCESGVKE